MSTTHSTTMTFDNGETSEVTFTWEVTGMKTSNEGGNANAIVQTYWRKTGTDDLGNTAKFDGATPFTSLNVPEGEFIPFEELTEEIVLSWIYPVVTGSYAEHVNGQIKKTLGGFRGIKKEVTTLPWKTADITPGNTAGGPSEPAPTNI